MKRLVYFLLLVGGIGAASYLVLFTEYGFIGGTGLDYLKDVLEVVKNGDWEWTKFDILTIFTYGLVAFLFINAVLILALLIMAVTTLLRFGRVYRFYATFWWFLLSALVFTGVTAYVLVDSGSFMDALKEVPWEFYVPIAVAFVMVVIGVVFKKSERM
jgi:hypothetical protein